MIALLNTRIDERTTPADLERIRRNLFDALNELQQSAFARATTAKDIALIDGVATPIPHKLGVPGFAIISPLRNAIGSGRIDEIRDTQYDRSLFVVLRAVGFLSTITVDVKVVPL